MVSIISVVSSLNLAPIEMAGPSALWVVIERMTRACEYTASAGPSP